MAQDPRTAGTGTIKHKQKLGLRSICPGHGWGGGKAGVFLPQQVPGGGLVLGSVAQTTRQSCLAASLGAVEPTGSPRPLTRPRLSPHGQSLPQSQLSAASEPCSAPGPLHPWPLLQGAASRRALELQLAACVRVAAGARTGCQLPALGKPLHAPTPSAALATAPTPELYQQQLSLVLPQLLPPPPGLCLAGCREPGLRWVDGCRVPSRAVALALPAGRQVAASASSGPQPPATAEA